MRRFLQEERGAFLALFVVIGSACLLVMAIAFNVGNWLEHRRHLQGQVDAGVLSTARDFSFCFALPDIANANIAASSRFYAGDPDVTGSHNQQVGDPARVAMVLNATDYPPTGVDAFTPVPDPARMPCALKSLEMKAKDSAIPSLLSGVVPGGLDFVDVRARAKVEIRQVEVLEGMLPWAIPEIDPKSVAAIVVNEATGEVLAAQELNDPVTAPLNGRTVSLWEGDVIPGGGGIAPRTGTIALVSQLENPDLTGTLTEMCTQPNTKCYAGSLPTSGLHFIRGLPASIPAGTASAPQLVDVELQNVVGVGGCTDDSAPYFVLNADCDIRVRAKIDFGTGAADPTPNPTRARVDLDGTNMTWTAGWFEATITVDALDGRLAPFDLNWQTGNGPSSASDTFNEVAHPYSVDDASDPIDYASVTVGGLEDHTQTVGAAPVLHIAFGLRPNLQVGQAGDPAILLRFASPSGSLNQALDCDHGATFTDEVRDGCQQPYRVNDSGDCSAYGSGDLPPNPLDPDPANAPDCVAAKPGDTNGFRTALHDRFETPCSENLWPDDPNPTNLPDDDDPRWVTLVVTDYTAFSGSGSTNIPVIKFAGFYATGWDYHPSQTPGCPGNDDHPIYGPVGSYNHSRDNGDVWGHFINIIVFVPGGTESEDLCAFDEVGVCTAVLTE